MTAWTGSCSTPTSPSGTTRAGSLWWRRWHEGSDETLDNAHLMRLAGRFSRRVRAFGSAHGIPVIDCTREERKHRIAEGLPA